MKTKALTLLMFLFGMSLLGQMPTGISYQTIIRNNEGQAIANKEIRLKINIRSATADGEVVYSEIHTVTSNNSGLVNLVIGRGVTISGSFQDIGWGKTSFYFETLLDTESTGDFLMLGTTQFLSVPYAFFAESSGGILCLSEQERNNLENPKTGMQIFNTTTKCLNFYNGTGWFETCGNEIKNQPPSAPFNPSIPDNAGNQPLQLELTWECNDPENNPLTFDIYFGVSNPPQLTKTGISDPFLAVNGLQPATTYYWHIVAFDGKGNTTTGPVWNFQTTALADPVVDAGPDQTVCENFPVDLAATASDFSNVQWFTEGFGVFSNENTLTTIYYPSFIDYMIGFTKLTIIVSPVPPSTTFSQDTMFLFYVKPPTTPNAGPDQLNLPGNGTQLQANTPVTGTGIWSIVSGAGGAIENPSGPLSQFTGKSGETYILRWSVFSDYCTLTDEVTISFQSWQCGQKLTDFRDQHEYNTKQIGTQCWMAQNLNVGTQINISGDQSNNSTIEKYCYQDLADKCNVYGGLYQWNEMMDYTNVESGTGICPTGWHIPSHSEFIDLIHTLGDVNVAGGKMKSTGTIEAQTGLWAAPNTGATNSSGFTGHPGGFSDVNKQYYYIGYFGYFWTSTENNSTSAWYRGLYNYGEAAHSYSYNKNYGFSIRCIKD